MYVHFQRKWFQFYYRAKLKENMSHIYDSEKLCYIATSTRFKIMSFQVGVESDSAF